MKLLPLALCFGSLGGLGASSALPVSVPPVAVELFTSQGCSSCPPADSLLTKLAQDRSIVAITRPVTYWDQLGWKDTFARPANTQLQRAYATRGGEGAGVYTPQIVVQGKAFTIGSREAAVHGLIVAARRLRAPDIAVAQGIITIQGRGGTPALLFLETLRPSATVAIGAGENGGRTVRYTNVVVGEHMLGTWHGGTGRFVVPTLQAGNRYALILRSGTTGPILAARYL